MKRIFDILRGVLIGAANVIPGVSGGTMMVSMGIYDKIIGAITHFTKQWKKSVLTLLPYLIGMAIGIVGSAFTIEKAFERFPLPTALLFIGLIFGGIPMLFKHVKGSKTNIVHVLLFLVFFCLVVGLQILGNHIGLERSLTPGVANFIIAFLIGTIAAATMIIPGVSGSMVMMILGYYTAVIGLINDCISSLLAFDIKALLSSAIILIPFGLGVIFGIVAVAHLIEFLMKRYEKATYCAILGLVIASPFPVFMNAGIGTIGVGAIFAAVVTFVVGFVGAMKLGGE